MFGQTNKNEFLSESASFFGLTQNARQQDGGMAGWTKKSTVLILDHIGAKIANSETNFLSSLFLYFFIL